MRRTSVVVALIFVLVPFRVPAHSQSKIPRIGFLSTVALSTVAPRTEAFRDGLREVGYLEGKNILILWRDADGRLDRLNEVAAKLVQLGVDIIVTAAPAPTRAAKEATAKIPIVMAFDNDPVSNGFVDSLAHPGGNVTGLSTHYPEITGKQIELLKEITPSIQRVAVLGNAVIPGTRQALQETEDAAAAFGVQVQYLDLRESRDIDKLFLQASKAHVGAVLVLSNPIATSHRITIIEAAAKNHLPAMYPQSDHIDAGGLLYYGVSITDLYRRAAKYVDKILRGAKPADLPVEQPTKFELVINLKASKQIGLIIPPNVLARADRVIR